MITSCVENVDLDINNADSRISFYCEFEPEKTVSFKYSTATGLSDLLEPINPTLTSEFDIEFKENSEIFEPVFRYNPFTKLFDAPSVSFPAAEGTYYDVRTTLKDYEHLGEISATTFVPHAKELMSLELMELNKTGAEIGFHLNMRARFTVDVNSPYYEVKAYTSYTEDNGLIVEKPLEFELVGNQSGILKMDHRSSILIETASNKGQYITIEIDDEVSDLVLAHSEHVYFKVHTVNEHHYRYHENKAKRIESANAPISEPVIYYTNIENGLGLFSGYSTKIDSLSIK